MKRVRREDLNKELEKALQAAEGALEKSYSPHSGLCVAAALVTRNGSPITGINYECDSYGLTLCAERTAIARAQAEGRIDEIEAVVLSAKWRNKDELEKPLTPCGACRQWLSELAIRLKRDLPVYSFCANQPEGIQSSAKALLPGSFSLDEA